mgnify:CR=1 FL=1
MKKSVKFNLAISSLVLGLGLSCGAIDLSSNIREDYSSTQKVAFEEFDVGCKSCDKEQHLMNVAAAAANASSSAYYHLDVNERLDSKDKDYPGIAFGNINGVRAGFVKKVDIDGQPYIVVSIHGTANWDDFLTDANAILKSNCPFLKNAPVHRGFYNRYATFREEMINAVKNCFNTNTKEENPKILVTGHSLGGALATLAALELEQMPQFSNKVRMVTFCSPRVLTSEAQKVASRILPESRYRALRVWRIGDTIAKVGPGSMGYKHFGESWGVDVAPGEGVKNYADPLAWHSITGMVEEMENLKNKKSDFKENVKVNSRFEGLKGAPARVGKALLDSGKYITSFFWR